jgi:hypothetical protein
MWSPFRQPRDRIAPAYEQSDDTANNASMTRISNLDQLHGAPKENIDVQARRYTTSTCSSGTHRRPRTRRSYRASRSTNQTQAERNRFILDSVRAHKSPNKEIQLTRCPILLAHVICRARSRPQINHPTYHPGIPIMVSESERVRLPLKKHCARQG